MLGLTLMLGLMLGLTLVRFNISIWIIPIILFCNHMYYNLLNATCNLDLPKSDRIINKLIVVADKEEEEEEGAINCRRNKCHTVEPRYKEVGYNKTLL